ncbi:unnamed protein product [Rotaria sp. Silwood2]|nr:unnamed protein product [Rotaria sp. Silwood2]
MLQFFLTIFTLFFSLTNASHFLGGSFTFRHFQQPINYKLYKLVLVEIRFHISDHYFICTPEQVNEHMIVYLIGESVPYDEINNRYLWYKTDAIRRNKYFYNIECLSESYNRACKQRVWWCVRHCAGMLGMQNQSIAQRLIAILAQQKQLTIGLPPAPREHVLTSPITVEQLYNTIVAATGNDPTMVMLTQEILVFLHTFISTEPQLFAGMIRIRVGLIIQVMLGELKRTLQSSDEDTADHLLNLSPYEIKCLLHIILSGKEFGITEHSTKPAAEFADLSKQERDMRIIRNEIKEASTKKLSVHLNWGDHPSEDDDDDVGKHGQWIRRRRLDGALNRVPVRFYGQVWQTLEKCKGIKIADYILYNSLTQEMTQEEIKFALRVEEALNRVPFTEYRQLIVEACVILTSIALGDTRFHWDEIISIEDIVSTANGIFLHDQSASGGDATKCCASGNPCGSAAGICLHFYDSAPSGRFGTINYFLRALLKILRVDETSVCSIS